MLPVDSERDSCDGLLNGNCQWREIIPILLDATVVLVTWIPNRITCLLLCSWWSIHLLSICNA